jgi:hypothetical protein
MLMKTNTQGQSCATIDKQRRISSALVVSMQLAEAAGQKYLMAKKGKNRPDRATYWHFDANAGCGWNDEFDVPGSPLVFHCMADKYLRSLNRDAIFCDIDRDRIKELRERLSEQKSYEYTSMCLNIDNETALGVFRDKILNSGENPKYAVGTIIIDPNGYWHRSENNVGPPVEGLQDFAVKFPRIDIIINISTRICRMMMGHKRNGHPAFQDVQWPREILISLKRHWIIGWSPTGNQFLIGVGRSMPVREHARLGLYDMDGPEGIDIMNKVTGRNGE